MASEMNWWLRTGLLAVCACLVACGKKEPEEAAQELPEEEVLDPSVIEELALEERQLEKIRKGWKASAYRKTRGGLVKGALGLLGTVEENADHPLMDNLPVEVRDLIVAAGGETGKLKDLADDPPPEVGLVVAAGYLVHLQKTPALCELDLVDEEGFATPGGRSGFHVVRGATYFMHGLKQHGLRDLRAANLGSASALPPEIRTAIYLGAAASAIAVNEPRMARTQLEMAEELSPEEPAIVFLRAEQDISKRRFDEAAEALAKWREANPDTPGVVADVIDERIAALAANDGSLETILTEPKWLINFGLDYIADKSGTSEAFRKLDEVTGTVRTMMSDLLERFTGFGL